MSPEEKFRKVLDKVDSLLLECLWLLDSNIVPENFDRLHDEVANFIVDTNTGKAFIAVARDHLLKVKEAHLLLEEE